MNQRDINQLSAETRKILVIIKDTLHEQTDIIWTRFDTVCQLKIKIDDCINRLELNDMKVFDEVNYDFSPTSTYQELAIQNGWGQEYIALSEKYDGLYIEVCNLIKVEKKMNW